jgi:DNA ligase (NAD+)
MYPQEKTRQLQKLTTSFLKKKDDVSFNKNETEELLSILRFHEYRYYILNDFLKH